MKFLSKLILFISSLLLISSCQETEDIILFNSNRNGNSDIFLMNGDGKNITQITDSKEEEWAAVWIDKDHISFLRQSSDSIQIIKKNLNNLSEEILPQTNSCKRDDKNIAYSPINQRRSYICNNLIMIEDRHSGKMKNLPPKKIKGEIKYLGWGHEYILLFTSNQDGANNVCSFSLQRWTFNKLTDTNYNDERGDLNPLGDKLAFSSNRNNNNQDIFIKNLLTGETENITNSSGTELISKWSNDGSKIYYGSNKDGNWEIYVYELKTKNTTRLTNNSAFDGDPQIRKF